MNKNIDIQKFDSYKEIVKFLLIDETGVRPRGIIRRLAEQMNCDPSFISHLLKRDLHFSLEHAISFGEYFNLSHEQLNYFVTLILMEKSEMRRQECIFRRF